MINAFVVTWRESLEALLVVAVLLAWIARQGEAGRLRRGVWAGLGGGVALAAAIARGARRLDMRTLLRASEWLLLAVATAMLGQGIERLIGLEWLPALADPLWDSSALLDDGSGVGRVLADFAGYRSRPTGSLVFAYVLFWSVALLALWPQPAVRSVRASAA